MVNKLKRVHYGNEEIVLNLYENYKIIYIPKGEFINSLKCMLKFLLFLK